jgi:hypothetical protein|tara:strand:+ start:84 stop:251 length:168 start_codon:yes stop_codon:yes gene_type:complete
MNKKTFIKAFILNAKRNGWKVKRQKINCYTFIKYINNEHYSNNYLNKFISQNLIK